MPASMVGKEEGHPTAAEARLDPIPLFDSADPTISVQLSVKTHPTGAPVTSRLNYIVRHPGCQAYLEPAERHSSTLATGCYAFISLPLICRSKPSGSFT